MLKESHRKSCPGLRGFGTGGKFVPLLRGSIGDVGDVSVGCSSCARPAVATSRSRWESVSATANRRAAGRRSSPKSGNDTSYAGTRLAADRARGHVQPLGVMGDQLVGSADRVGDRLAVAAVAQSRGESIVRCSAPR